MGLMLRFVISLVLAAGAVGCAGARSTGVDGGGQCDAQGACAPGTSQACGKCGTQVCAASCNWETCTGQTGVCTPGDTQPCGSGGTQTCTTGCGWGSCSNGGCTPGSAQA